MQYFTWQDKSRQRARATFCYWNKVAGDDMRHYTGLVGSEMMFCPSWSSSFELIYPKSFESSSFLSDAGVELRQGVILWQDERCSEVGFKQVWGPASQSSLCSHCSRWGVSSFHGVWEAFCPCGIYVQCFELKVCLTVLTVGKHTKDVRWSFLVEHRETDRSGGLFCVH